MRPLLHSIALTTCLLTAGISAARADDIIDKGREIFTKHQHAVVTIGLVQKAAVPGRNSRESKQEITGTLVDSSGLIVVALSSCDPSELYRHMFEDYKTEVEITDMKILLEDGTEVPAAIVLRDKDLDLAFIRPKTKNVPPMESIDFSKSGKADILDPLITINRLKQAAGRAFAASVERVSAVIHRPRTFYIPESNMTETSSGSPAFGLDGSIVGLFVMRAVNAQSAANARDCITPIILPAEDVAKAAAQAPAEAKVDEEKKDVPAAASSNTNGIPPKADAPNALPK